MNFYCSILYACILLFIIGSCKTNDSPGFFLKVTKNVPRLGRRSDKDLENNFWKNYNAIPRIGRSMYNNNDDDMFTVEDWLNKETFLRKLDKRALYNPTRIATPERELSVVQPVNSNTLIELLNKDAIPSDNVKFVHWKDFDLALQLDVDLYTKVISLGRRPDQSLKHDLNIGSYIPLFSGGPAANRPNNFMLYNQATNTDDNFNSDVLRYNHI